MVSMTLRDLPRENTDVDGKDVWENGRTPTPVRCFAVRLHSMGLSVREVEGVLAWLSVDRCYQAVWNCRRDTSGEVPRGQAPGLSSCAGVERTETTGLRSAIQTNAHWAQQPVI